MIREPSSFFSVSQPCTAYSTPTGENFQDNSHSPLPPYGDNLVIYDSQTRELLWEADATLDRLRCTIAPISPIMNTSPPITPLSISTVVDEEPTIMSVQSQPQLPSVDVSNPEYMSMPETTSAVSQASYARKSHHSSKVCSTPDGDKDDPHLPSTPYRIAQTNIRVGGKAAADTNMLADRLVEDQFTPMLIENQLQSSLSSQTQSSILLSTMPQVIRSNVAPRSRSMVATMSHTRQEIPQPHTVDNTSPSSHPAGALLKHYHQQIFLYLSQDLQFWTNHPPLVLLH